MSALVHTRVLAARQLRAFVRVPAFFVMNLVQPLIWLLLFGELFRSVAQIPGFTGGDYLTFLTPGIVMMMAMFGAAWTGTGFIHDMERGVMDRMLTSPTSRGAMIVSTLAYQSVLTVLQTAVLLTVAWSIGVRFSGGVVGVTALVAAAVLLTMVFGALSDAVALAARQQNALIGISQLLTFPLMFLSSAIMDTSLSPSWVQTVARLNPFEWAVIAGRTAVSPNPDWGSVAGHLGLLAAAAAVLVVVATTTFRSYQRSA